MISPESVWWALGRLEDFMAIHPISALSDPVEILTEGYGIDPEVLIALAEWCEEQDVAKEHQGGLVLGILIGAMASEHES